jgi:hypothetical protein
LNARECPFVRSGINWISEIVAGAWRIYAFGMARVAGGDGIVGRGQVTARPRAVQLNKLLDLTLARVFT